MTTVKIYKTTCTKSFMMGEQGTGYSLSPWGDDTEYYEGYDDGGEIYTLPNGYEVAQSKSGTDELYDEAGNHCTLVVGNKSGLPVAVSFARSVVLSKN
jgi:hypothetical protein